MKRMTSAGPPADFRFQHRVIHYQDR